MMTFCFIDASNLFYGGEKSLGWKIDYKKLLQYLREKYSVSKVYYFGGIETHRFVYDYQQNGSVPLEQLEQFLNNSIKQSKKYLNEAELILIGKHIQRVRFYKRLDSFGYKLILKPVKLYKQEDGSMKKKANCDVDLTFYLMKEKDNFDRALILSGDGDFFPVMKHLQDIGKTIFVLARAPRTAKEIKKFAASNFRDFEYLKHRIQWQPG